MKVLIWYIDVNGLTRIQVVDKPYYIPMLDFLQNFQTRSTVRTVLQAFTVSAVHEVHGSGNTIDYIVTT